jgi:hypothetical protein
MPKPCPYDASVATVAAHGMQMLSKLLGPTERAASRYYLSAVFKLINNMLHKCDAPPTSIKDSMINWGDGDWETILMHSTINRHPYTPCKSMDHSLIYAELLLHQVCE